MQTGSWRTCQVVVVGVLALLGAGEAAAQPDEVEGTCSNYQLFPASATVSRNGASATLDLTWDWERPPFDGMCVGKCTYESCGDSTGSVRSSATWLSGTKNGNDQVDYTAGAHTGSSSRSATLTVAGATFTVTQPEPCPATPDSVSPTSVDFGHDGWMRAVTVNGRADCDWSVSTDQWWIGATPASVFGGNSVTVSAGQNIGAARSGTVTIGGTPTTAGETIDVSQEAYVLPDCPVRPGVTDVDPSSLVFDHEAGAADVTVTIVHVLTLLPCGPRSVPVAVTAGESWISVRPSSLYGWSALPFDSVTLRPLPFDPPMESVTVSVTRNDDSAERSGTVTIGSRDIPVTQLAPPPPTNEPPEAENDEAATRKNRAVTVRVLDNDTDPDSDSLEVDRVVNGPRNGNAAVSSDRQTILYTPSPGWAGAATFTYRVTDGEATADAQVAVTVENTPPVAVDDRAATTAGAAVTVTVLANDFDADGDLLEVERIVTGPTNGAATVSNQEIVYTPPTGWSGTGTLTYRVTDGEDADDATVTVGVSPVARNDAVTTNQDTDVTAAVLGNDIGDAIRVTAIVTAPTNGTAVIDPGNATITYTPSPGFADDDDTFRYRIADSAGRTAEADVTVSVGLPPPQAVDDTATTTPNSPVTVSVLANDSGDTIRVSAVVSLPSDGTAVIDSGNATITYTPSPGFADDDDTFRYRIADSAGRTAEADVTVSVGLPPPQAVDDTATTTPNSPVTVSVLANDSGDTIRVSAVVSPPSDGTAVIDTGNESITYTPSSGFADAADTFRYRIADSAGRTAEADVTVSVGLPPPQAVDDTATTTPNSPVTVSVLANDSGDTIRVSAVVSPPSDGTAVIDTGNESITYTPSSGFADAADTFRYRIADSTGRTAEATVTVTVRPGPLPPPQARDDIATTTPTTPVTVPVLVNDSGDGIRVSAVVTPPTNGAAAIDTGGETITYTPSPGPTDAHDTFRYRIVDSAGRTAEALVTVTREPCPTSPSTVTPEEVTFLVAGGSEDVSVVGPSGCSWSVSADQPWITVSPASVMGGGWVTIRVTDGSVMEMDGPERFGLVTIGGLGVAVQQIRASCPAAPVVSPASPLLGYAAGATRVLHLRATPATCQYLVTPSISWLRASPPMVRGNGAVTLTTLSANDTGAPRSGSLMVGNQDVRVTQDDGRANRRPIAIAGPDQTVAVGAHVTLNGTASSDPDGDTLRYRWRQTRGPAVVLFDTSLFYETTNEPELGFRAPAPHADIDLGFSLTVTDGREAASVDEVVVRILGGALTARRDTLLEDWASRDGRSGDVCAEWKGIDPSAQEVFIWNTHRLSITDMLPHVQRLYAIYGKNPHDYEDCGGEGHNRTFMGMDAALQRKLVATWWGGVGDKLVDWKRTGDAACYLSIPIILDAKCPHEPYQYQVDTHLGRPRGQINFFGPSVVVGRRYLGLHGENCGEETVWAPRSTVCKEESCLCTSAVDCPRSLEAPYCAGRYADSIVFEPAEDSYAYGPEGRTVNIADEYAFEMDQDYNWWRGIHDSAPSCNRMMARYALEYGNPGWGWSPSACGERRGFTDSGLTPGLVAPRALHLMELRGRIGALRLRLGLAAFAWTDDEIVQGVTPVRTVHVTDLPTALRETYGAAGRAAPTYTDGVLVPGLTAIKTVHWVELRDAVLELERQ